MSPISLIALCIILAVVVSGIYKANKHWKHASTEDIVIIRQKLLLLYGQGVETESALDDSTQILHIKYLRRTENAQGITPRYCLGTAVIHKSDGTYWLAFVYSDDQPDFQEQISELRARRALFQHPERYAIVYGVQPHRDQLKQLIKQQEKIDRFDPAMHGKFFHESEPVGKEFGSRTV